MKRTLWVCISEVCKSCPIPFRKAALKALQELYDCFLITDFREKKNQSIMMDVHLRNDHSTHNGL